MADGKFGGKTIYSYNSNGNLIEEVNYKPDGSLVFKTIYTYDIKGHPIEIEYTEDEKRFSKTILKYDNNGHVIQTKIKSGKEKGWTVFNNVFDDKGNKISETHVFPDGRPSSLQTSWKYNDKGNVIEQIDTGTSSLKGHYVNNYEYDDHGNWIKRTGSLYGEVPSGIEERVIVYF